MPVAGLRVQALRALLTGALGVCLALASADTNQTAPERLSSKLASVEDGLERIKSIKSGPGRVQHGVLVKESLLEAERKALLAEQQRLPPTLRSVVDMELQQLRGAAAGGGSTGGFIGGGGSSSRAGGAAKLPPGELPPGLAFVGDDVHIEPSTVAWAMEGGYRVFDSETPPWVERSEGKEGKNKALHWVQMAEEAALQMRTDIHNEYGASEEKGHHRFNEKLFPKGLSEKGFNTITNDVQGRVASRMLLALLGQTPAERKFTFAFTGHSNLAGHGNYFDHTYPFQMGRTLAKAFNKAGLRLAVQNFGAGGTSTIPTTGWCGPAQVGDEVDVAVWDFGMTEGAKNMMVGEAWIRSFLSLPGRAPANLVFMEHARAKKWSSIYSAHVGMASLDKSETGLPLMANHTDTPEAMRWLHPDCKKFNGGTPENVWCRKEKWGPARHEMEWRIGKKGDLESGIYREGRKRAGSCPGMVVWHDGFKLHALKGRLLAHFYSRCLNRALAELKERLKALPDHADFKVVGEAVSALRKEVEAVAKRHHKSLPKAGGDCSKVPFCPHLEHTKCRTSVQPTVSSHMLAAKDETGAALSVSLDKPNSSKKSDEALCRMGFIDYKYSLAVEPAHGWVAFSEPLTGLKKDSSIVVCEPQTGWNRDKSMALFDNKGETAWELGGAALGPPKSMGIMKECYEFKNFHTKESPFLRVKATGGKPVRITHLVWTTA